MYVRYLPKDVGYGAKQYPPTLCWKCKRLDCSWMRDLIPVKGWTAYPTVIKNNGDKSNSYHVADCPLFIPFNTDCNDDTDNDNSNNDNNNGNNNNIHNDNNIEDEINRIMEHYNNIPNDRFY